MNQINKIALTLLISVGLFSCMKMPENDFGNDMVKTMDNLVISKDFDWQTTITIDVSIKLPENINVLPLRITSVDDKRIYFVGYPENEGRILFTKITVPAYETQLKLVFSGLSGVPAVIVSINGNYLDFDTNTMLKGVRVPCDLSGIQTYSQHAWHSAANGNNIGSLRDAYFPIVFPGGLVIGDPLHYSIRFESSQAIADFLPATGHSKVLSQNATNPSNAAGVGLWAGQIAAAMLNVAFDEAAVYPQHGSNQLKDLVFIAGPFKGMSVENFLILANKAIGGGGTDGFSINEYAYAAEQINLNFENGSKNFLTCTTNSGGDGTGPTEVHLQGTLAYEDLWPWKGDYDFNDIVIAYDFNVFKNIQEQVRHITATFTLHAFGASYLNGFGFSLPSVPPDAIISVSGSRLKSNTYINLIANGLEAGQTNATVIVFDDAYDLMPHPGIGIGVNTESAAPYVTPVSVVIEMKFLDNNTAAPGGPVSFSQLNIGGFNPFIIVDQNRGVEVHLPGYHPTSLANESMLFSGENSTGSLPFSYYKTITNLPWAINIPEVFHYPIEKQEITGAYLRFADWAESGGQLYPDWYKNIEGYTNQSLIYQARN